MLFHDCQARRISYFLEAVKTASPSEHDLTGICWRNRRIDGIQLENSDMEIQEIFEEVVASVCELPVNFSYLQLTNAIEFFMRPLPGTSKNPPERAFTPLQRVVHTVTKITGKKELNFKLAGNFLRALVKIIFYQHIYDPLKYVSHDFRHPLNLINTSRLILKDKKNTLMKFMQDKYPFLNDMRIEGIIELCMILHDCGYPYLSGRGKAAHAITSAEITDEFKEYLQNLLELSAVEFRIVFDDLREAIFVHNADTVDPKEFTIKRETNIGTIIYEDSKKHLVETFFELKEPGISQKRVLFSRNTECLNGVEGRCVDLIKDKDQLIGIAYQVVKASENPLAAHLRLVDNLDFTKHRFNDLQSNEYFCYLYKLRGNLSVKDKNNREIKESVCIERLKELDPANRSIIEGLDEESVNHFGGCEAVEEFIHIKIRKTRVEIQVKINKIVWDLLGTKMVLTKKTKQPICEIRRYQFFRAHEAFKSIQVFPNAFLNVGFIVFDQGHDQIYPEKK